MVYLLRNGYKNVHHI